MHLLSGSESAFHCVAGDVVSQLGTHKCSSLSRLHMQELCKEQDISIITLVSVLIIIDTTSFKTPLEYQRSTIYRVENKMDSLSVVHLEILVRQQPKTYMYLTDWLEPVN